MNPYIENLEEYESVEELEELKKFYEDCLYHLNHNVPDVHLPIGSQAYRSLDVVTSGISIMKEKLEDELDGLDKLIELVYDHLDQASERENERLDQERYDDEFLEWLIRSGRK